MGKWLLAASAVVWLGGSSPTPLAATIEALNDVSDPDTSVGGDGTLLSERSALLVNEPGLIVTGCDLTCQRNMTNLTNNTRLKASGRWWAQLPAPPAACVGPHGGQSCLSDRACDTAPGSLDGYCVSTGANTQPIASPVLRNLTWDPVLAAAGQSRSDLCDLQPDPANEANGWGENTAGGPGNTLGSPSSVVGRWEHEVNFYTFGSVSPQPPCSAGAPACPVNQTCNVALARCVPDSAEYIQLVWAATERLGCGHTVCPATTGPFGVVWDYWVCKYAPAGNVVGSTPYSLAVGNCSSDAACNDGNACTTDVCANQGTPSAACTHTNNTLPCDDGNICTDPDVCGGGRCLAGPDVCPGCASDTECDDANPCTDDTCIGPGTPSALCVYADNSDPCDDLDPCTAPDACAGGSCVPGPRICPGCTGDADCNDNNPCTDDTCLDPGGANPTCVHGFNAASCDDGLFCNGVDNCSLGICDHSGDPCAGGTECNATCQESPPSCFAPSTVRCTADTNSCTSDVCDGAGGCSHPNKLVGTTCDDANPCTTSDTCDAAGQCLGGPPRSCDDNNPCTDDFCDPALGCRSVPSPGPRPVVYFSPAANQFLGGFSARDEDIFRSDTCGIGVTRAVDPFVPAGIGVDAVDVRSDGNIVFSVRIASTLHHTGGVLSAKPENVYLYEVATGVIRTIVDWQALGISMANLDAVDQLADGTIAFSVDALRGVNHGGGFTQLRPQNVYRLDPATRRITLLLDGQALGLIDLDGVDVYPDGRIAFSTKTNGLVRGVSVKHQSAYTLEPNGSLTLSLDGTRIGLQSLDGFTLEGAME